MLTNDKNELIPKGTVLGLKMGLYNHYAIYDGNNHVIHNSKKHGKVVRESLIDFYEGKTIFISDIQGPNFHNAYHNAEQYLGMRYNLFEENCEHFVRKMHGLVKESKQVKVGLVVVAAAALAYLLRPKREKY